MHNSHSEIPAFVKRLKFHAIQVVFGVKARTRMPNFPSDRTKKLRGAFNAAMTRIHCQGRNPTGRPCSGCHCLYGKLAAKHPPQSEGLARRFKDLPPPLLFWLPDHPGSPRPGGEIRFNLTLIGDLVHFLPFLIPVFNDMARFNLGQGDGDFHLDRVLALDHESKPAGLLYSNGMPHLPPWEVPSITLDRFTGPIGHLSRLSLRFSPMVILYEKKEPVSRPSMAFFMERLLGRMALLAAATGDHAYHPPGDHSAALSKGIHIESHLTLPTIWSKRDSGRSLKPGQVKRVRHLPGLIGALHLSGENLPAIYPLLKFGEWCHVGKMTLFGMGRYKVSVEKSLPAGV